MLDRNRRSTSYLKNGCFLQACQPTEPTRRNLQQWFGTVRTILLQLSLHSSVRAQCVHFFQPKLFSSDNASSKSSRVTPLMSCWSISWRSCWKSYTAIGTTDYCSYCTTTFPRTTNNDYYYVSATTTATTTATATTATATAAAATAATTTTNNNNNY